MAEPEHPAFHPSLSGDLLSKTNLFKWIREFIRECGGEKGYYMEFGVLNGEGIINAYRQIRPYLSHVYGFDSFAGFPDLEPDDSEALDLHPGFDAGAYKGMSLEMVAKNIVSNSRMPEEKLSLVKGNFDQSLPSFDKNILQDKGSPVCIYIDCDLYSSTKYVLDFIRDLVVDGTWILLDDYWCYRGSPKHGQRKAFEEWLNSNKVVGATPYCNFCGWGRAYIAYRH